MSRLTVLTTIAILSAAPAFASGEHAGGHDSVMAMGMPGDASQVDRTIDVTMKETEYGEMVYTGLVARVRVWLSFPLPVDLVK